MSDQSLEKIANLADEAAIENELNGLVAHERDSLKNVATQFKPRSRGSMFPVLLNLGALFVLLALAWVLFGWYAAAQDSYVLKAADRGNSGEDIISALLAEAQDALAAKNKEIAAIEAELLTIENQLSKLGLEMVVERKNLTDRRTTLQANLARAIKEREEIARQVAMQSRKLEQARSAGTSSDGNPLQDLMEQQELRKIYQQRMQSSSNNLKDLIGQRKWDGALAELGSTRTFLNDFSKRGTDADKANAASQLRTFESIEALVRAAQEGWPQDEDAVQLGGDAAELLEIIQKQTVQLEELSAQTFSRTEDLRVQSDRVKTLETLNRVSAEQLETVLRSFQSSVGAASTSTGSVTMESLPQRIQDLQQIVATVQDYRSQVERQSAEIQVLKASGAGSSAQLGAVLSGMDQLYAAFDPGSSAVSTVENLPQRMEELQALILRGQDSSALVQQQAVRLSSLEAEKEAWARVGRDYAQRLEKMSDTALSNDREELRRNLTALVGLLTTHKIAAELLPDFSVQITTVVENLIAVETDRVKALAQEELLSFMTATSGKLADEQVRLLARASNANQDATTIFTSLIKEIDQVTDSTRKELSGKSVPKALGTVISVTRPNVTVRKVSRFETFKVKRVFLSRILANGDRIPIAEAEIVATTSEDIILKIISTIAPTIYPERNDLVFVEL